MRAELETAALIVAGRLGVHLAEGRRIAAGIRVPPPSHAWRAEESIAGYVRRLPLTELAELAGQEVPQ